MSRKIIEIRIKDAEPCEFESPEELRRYVEAHRGSEHKVDWAEALKHFQTYESRRQKKPKSATQ